MGLKIGDKAPVFTTTTSDGTIFNSLDYIGKKPIVLYFYPKNNTPGCTAQACSFRDKYQDFKDLGAQVIGVSSDTQESHEKFVSHYRLPFILLADVNKELRKLFGVSNDYLGLLPGRTTYVIDKQGFIVFIFDSTKATEHIPQALAAIKKM